MSSTVFTWPALVSRPLKKSGRRAGRRTGKQPPVSHIGSPDVAALECQAYIYTQGQMLRLVPLKEAQGDDTIRCRGF